MTTTAITQAISAELVALDVAPPQDRETLVRGMSEQLLAAGRIGDLEEFRQALAERESLGSTYMGNDLALPHGRSSTVRRPSIVYWRLAAPMTYQSGDESGPVTRAVMLAVPEGGAQEHLRVLALLARMLLDEESVTALDTATDADQVVDIVSRYVAARG